MGLVADSSELPLSDVIQVKGQSRATCRIQVEGAEGLGTVFLSEGAIVHARYAGLEGEEAARALLAEEDVSYHVASGLALPHPNMHADCRSLLLEMAISGDERRRGGTQPSRRAAPPARPPGTGLRRPTPAVAAACSGRWQAAWRWPWWRR